MNVISPLSLYSLHYDVNERSDTRKEEIRNPAKETLNIIWSKNLSGFIESTPFPHYTQIYLSALLHFSYVKSWLAPVQPPHQGDNCYIFFCVAATTSAIGLILIPSPAQPAHTISLQIVGERVL